MAEELARELPPSFYVLARRFWPGPLTLIVHASARVPLKVTGNTGRLALRQSRSRVAAALLESLGQPLIATSANISGLPTCRTGVEVFAMMDGRVDLVLDGGPCSGHGATTVDITEPGCRLIREGEIPFTSIEECLKQ
jgi:L-threonylcarbamoyladenylate synthase